MSQWLLPYRVPQNAGINPRTRSPRCAPSPAPPPAPSGPPHTLGPPARPGCPLVCAVARNVLARLPAALERKPDCAGRLRARSLGPTHGPEGHAGKAGSWGVQQRGWTLGASAAQGCTAGSSDSPARRPVVCQPAGCWGLPPLASRARRRRSAAASADPHRMPPAALWCTAGTGAGALSHRGRSQPRPAAVLRCGAARRRRRVGRHRPAGRRCQRLAGRGPRHLSGVQAMEGPPSSDARPLAAD